MLIVTIVMIQMKAKEQYFHVALFIMLYMVVLTFQFVGETLVYDHSHRGYWAVLPCTVVCFSIQGAHLLPVVDPIQNPFAQTVHLYQSGFDQSLYFVLQTN